MLPDSNAFGWVTLPPERFTLHVPAEVRISSQPGCAALTREAGSRKLSFRITLTSRRSWTLLSWAAAQTQTLKIAPNVLANLPLRQPAVSARAAASLDLLSGGRVVLSRCSSFPCLVRFVSGPGQVRYRLEDGLVDRYLEFVAGRCLPTEPSLRCAAQKEQE